MVGCPSSANAKAEAFFKAAAYFSGSSRKRRRIVHESTFTARSTEGCRDNNRSRSSKRQARTASPRAIRRPAAAATNALRSIACAGCGTASKESIAASSHSTLGPAALSLPSHKDRSKRKRQLLGISLGASCASEVSPTSPKTPGNTLVSPVTSETPRRERARAASRCSTLLSSSPNRAANRPAVSGALIFGTTVASNTSCRDNQRLSRWLSSGRAAAVAPEPKCAVSKASADESSVRTSGVSSQSCASDSRMMTTSAHACSSVDPAAVHITPGALGSGCTQPLRAMPIVNASSQIFCAPVASPTLACSSALSCRASSSSSCTRPPRFGSAPAARTISTRRPSRRSAAWISPRRTSNRAMAARAISSS